MQAPNSVRYEVYESNARHELMKLVAYGFHRDIAETYMHRKYMESKGEKTLVLLNTSENEIVSVTSNPTAIRF